MMKVFANTLFLALVAGIPLFGALKKVRVYDCFIQGGRDAFDIILRIIPYMVAMIVAINLLRVSGLLDLIALGLNPILSYFKVPIEILPLALIRPFSGSAATAFMADITQHAGGDAYLSKLAAIIMGSTETTFYVVAVYFGSVGILKTRHAVLTGLLADLIAVIAACFIAHLFFA